MAPRLFSSFIKVTTATRLFTHCPRRPHSATYKKKENLFSWVEWEPGRKAHDLCCDSLVALWRRVKVALFLSFFTFIFLKPKQPWNGCWFDWRDSAWSEGHVCLSIGIMGSAPLPSEYLALLNFWMYILSGKMTSNEKKTRMKSCKTFLLSVYGTRTIFSHYPAGSPIRWTKSAWDLHNFTNYFEGQEKG